MDGSLVPKDLNLPEARMQSKRGLGTLSEEDRIIPRLKIMQPLSPEVDEGIAKPGEFVNSIAKKSYGKVIAFTPILWWKSRVYWQRPEEGGAILCQSKDAITGTVYGACTDCEYSRWVDKEAPACTAIINVLGLVNNSELVAMGFMKTSYTAGKQLINLFNYKNVDIFNFQYEFSAVQEQNQMGQKYWVVKFKDLNTPVSDEVYAFCTALYDKLAKDKAKVEEIHPVE